MENAMRSYPTPDLVEALRLAGAARGLYVFGTGFVAEMFMSALRSHGLDQLVCGFVTSSEPSEGREFHGRPVLGAGTLATLLGARQDGAATSATLVCVAVHEALVEEIGVTLQAHGLADFAVWVYPNLYDLLYGEPVRRAVPVALDDILAAQDPRHHWIAVRVAAARHFMGMEPEGDVIYQRCIALHCGVATATSRLRSFARLSESVGERGLDPSHPLLLDEELQIIDGLHRVALAWCHARGTVTCDIVRPSARYGELIGDRNRLTEPWLARAGLSSGQLARVRCIQAELLRGGR